MSSVSRASLLGLASPAEVHADRLGESHLGPGRRSVGGITNRRGGNEEAGLWDPGGLAWACVASGAERVAPGTQAVLGLSEWGEGKGAESPQQELSKSGVTGSME